MALILRCDRCKKEYNGEIELGVVAGKAYPIMPSPNEGGWWEDLDGAHICGSCSDEYRQFMDGGKVVTGKERA